MRRTLPLLALLVACGAGVGYGTTVATGPAPVAEHAPHAQLDTTDRPADPTGRTYLPAPSSAAAAPGPAAIVAAGRPSLSSPAAPAGAVTRAPAPAVTAVEAPAPVTVTPSPAPVADPEPEGEQRPEEIIGSYRCPDPAEIVVALAADGSLVCEVAP